MSLIQQNMGAIYDGSQRLIAPVLNSTTATQNWEVGQEFILDGNLYKVTTAIPSGSQIIVSGSSANCELADTVTEQINNVVEQTKPEILTLTEFDPTKIKILHQDCWKSGHIVRIMVRVQVLANQSGFITIAGNLPMPKKLSYGLGYKTTLTSSSNPTNVDLLNGAVNTSRYLYWNGGGSTDDVLQIQFDYCTDE